MKPPLVIQNGYGRCIGCDRDLRAGEAHGPGCPIDDALREALRAAAPLVAVDVDSRRIARELAGKIKAQRDLEERMELDRVASGKPRKARKARKGAGQ
jgi:hypothetical protein